MIRIWIWGFFPGEQNHHDVDEVHKCNWPHGNIVSEYGRPLFSSVVAVSMVFDSSTTGSVLRSARGGHKNWPEVQIDSHSCLP